MGGRVAIVTGSATEADEAGQRPLLLLASADIVVQRLTDDVGRGAPIAMGESLELRDDTGVEKY